jgi:tripartite-type tricarboxylate transporter receptor subunit TctC
MNRKFRLCFASLLFCAGVFSFAVDVAFTQDYPQRPIRFIVPLAPGGASDITARIVAEKVKEVFGQPGLVENRPGADGRLGVDIVAKAEPDGYTLVFSSNGPITNAPSLFKKLPYDPVKDLEPITPASQGANLLLVHPSVPAKSVEELVKLAKSNPGKFNYGSAGIGQPPHLNMELFKMIAGIDVMHVPFKGSGESMTALLGGHVNLAFSSFASSLPYVKAGTLRALAVTSAKRSSLLPDVPTMAELGYPEVVTYTWFGILAPAKTPKQIVTKLNTGFVQILAMPDVVERMHSQGLEPMSMTPEEFAAFVKSEIAKWGKVAKAGGIEPK